MTTAEEPTINIPLLRKQLEWATAHPEEHNQAVWANPCGTAFCIAGHTVLDAGHEIDYARAVTSGDHQAFYLADGRFIEDVAREELGLSDRQASKLFWQHNSIDNLWQLAEEFTNGEITRPDGVS